jgi:hypothetical protein
LREKSRLSDAVAGHSAHLEEELARCSPDAS